MKKSISFVYRLFLAFGLCWISYPGDSQDVKSVHSEQKEAKKDEMIKNYYIMGTLLESRKFVFEADHFNYGFESRGVKELVEPAFNFIKVDSLIAVINYDYTNKYGTGRTCEGTLDGWILKKDSNKLCYNLQFRVLGATDRIGNKDIFHISHPNFNIYINIYVNKRAIARLYEEWSIYEEWHFYGRINPLGKQTIFYNP